MSDRRDDKTHPLGWSDDPKVQGEKERETFGPDKQSPQQTGESYADYQRRLYGNY